MVKYVIELRDDRIRPVFRYKDKYMKDYINILYDTGAVISLWCGDEESLNSTFRCKNTGLVMKVTGIGDYGKECNVYLITLVFGNIIIINVPIAVFDGADYSTDIILSRTIFSGINKVDVTSDLVLMVDSADSYHFNMLEPISRDGVYVGVKCDVVVGICPICGNRLLDNGKCIDFNCDFSIEK